MTISLAQVKYIPKVWPSIIHKTTYVIVLNKERSGRFISSFILELIISKIKNNDKGR